MGYLSHTHSRFISLWTRRGSFSIFRTELILLMLLSELVSLCYGYGNKSPLPSAAPSGYRLTSPALVMFFIFQKIMLWSISQAKSATIIFYLWFVVCVAQLKTVLCCDGMRINLYIYLKCVLTGWRVCVICFHCHWHRFWKSNFCSDWAKNYTLFVFFSLRL